MKPQTLIMLVIALGCGLAAMVLTQRYLKPGAAKADDSAKVLVAVAQIPQGAVINDQMVKETDWPKDKVPKDAILNIADLKNRPARFAFFPDEIIREEKLAPEGTQGLRAVLGKGMRAATIAITTDRAVAGFLKTDARVDIILTTNRRGTKGSFSKTILQNVRILAVDAGFGGEDDLENRGKTVNNVTFEVTPDQAETLAGAQNAGNLSLTLRGSDGEGEVKTAGVSENDILSTRSDAADAAVAPEVVIAKVPEEPEEKKPGLLEQFKSAMETVSSIKPPEPAEPITPVATVEPVPLVPPKKLKTLVYTDLQGNVLMEVKIPADSPYAESLKDYLKDEEDGEATGATAEKKQKTN